MAIEPAPLKVTLAYSPGPRQVREWHVCVPVGATVREVLAASGLYAEFAQLAQQADLEVAVWGRAAHLRQVVREGDRVEVTRPLQVDPKLARRERFRRQGARAAGLFAKKR